MISITVLIFILGVSCASAVNLDLEKGTNDHVNELVKNVEDTQVSSSDILGSKANTRFPKWIDPRGCSVDTLGSSANTKENPGSGIGCVGPLSSSVNTKLDPGSGNGCIRPLSSSANTKLDPGSGNGCVKQ